MNDDRTVLLIGGHDSGKTNYIVRLWLSIDSGKGRLRKNGPPEAFHYLRSISEHILAGRFAPHTSLNVQTHCVIPVRLNGDAVVFQGTLIIPDSAGEGWMNVFRSRSWSAEWEDLISQECSVLIFLRVDSTENVTPLDWINSAELYGSPADLPDQGGENHKEQQIPTQVLMVEWIQFLKKAFSERVGRSFRPRVGIIISAWDLAPLEQQARDPRIFLRDNYPLLHQYLETNRDLFDFNVFAVSIVGFDLNHPEEGQIDLYLEDPYASGYVVWSDGVAFKRDDDLTLPIAWALGLSK